MRREVDLLVQACSDRGLACERSRAGRLPMVRVPEAGLFVAPGGTGKAQFALQTQHLLDVGPRPDLVICAGAAGALSAELVVGDVVVGIDSVEHDYLSAFDDRSAPCFPAASEVVDQLRDLEPFDGFALHFGRIASGDEDIVDGTRRQELRGLTGALAVAWEGAGGARACAFNDIGFLELRGVTDAADHNAAADFQTNLSTCMNNLAAVLIAWTARR